MEWSKIATFVLGSDTITIDDTDEMFAGLNIYNSTYLPMGTTILSITNSTTLKLTDTALIDGSGTVIITDLVPYKYSERCEILKEIQNIINKEGAFIKINLRGETNLTKDDYNSIKIKNDTGLYFKAYPIIESPSKEQIEETGLKEDTEIIVYTAMQDWKDKSKTFRDIDLIKSTLIYHEGTWKIRDKKLHSQVGNDYGYIILGLKKE